MYRATRRRAKKDEPISIVCQFHCKRIHNWSNKFELVVTFTTYPIASRVRHRLHNRNYVSLLGEVVYAQKSFKLLKGYRNGGTPHESDNGSMRKELDQEA